MAAFKITCLSLVFGSLIIMDIGHGFFMCVFILFGPSQLLESVILSFTKFEMCLSLISLSIFFIPHFFYSFSETSVTQMLDLLVFPHSFMSVHVLNKLFSLC